MQYCTVQCIKELYSAVQCSTVPGWPPLYQYFCDLEQGPCQLLEQRQFIMSLYQCLLFIVTLYQCLPPLGCSRRMSRKENIEILFAVRQKICSDVREIFKANCNSPKNMIIIYLKITLPSEANNGRHGTDLWLTESLKKPFS